MNKKLISLKNDISDISYKIFAIEHATDEEFQSEQIQELKIYVKTLVNAVDKIIKYNEVNTKELQEVIRKML